MEDVMVTTLSTKGQVVIPGEIRNRLGLTDRSKLIVATDGNNILLKPIDPPQLKQFQRLIAETDRLMERSELYEADLKKEIAHVRRARRPRH